MKIDLEFLADGSIYRKVMREEVPAARRSLFIASALVKQTKVETAGGIVPFCELAQGLLERGVRLSFLVSGCPSRPFMDSLREFPAVLSGAVWRICPRNHMKAVLIDGERLYLGSANLTGAGLGMKGGKKRNFEWGLLTSDRNLIRRFSSLAEEILGGKHCGDCGAKKLCRKEHEAFSKAIPSDQAQD